MMWLSTSMTPQQGTDPTQKIMMQVMPLMFVFIMGRYPAGLLIYWAWSQFLSIAPAVFHHAPLQGCEPDRRFHRQNHGQAARLGDGVSDTFTEDEVEAARLMFARPVTFMMGCAKIEQLPDSDLPEVAFAGRSNVGKSSLINALTGQNHLARRLQRARPHAGGELLPDGG